MSTDTGSPDTARGAGKAVIRSFIDAWNSRDFGRFDILMADDAVLRIGGVVIPVHPAGTRAIAEEWTTAFPDWRFDLLALVADGDLVVAHMPYAGTTASPSLVSEPSTTPAPVDEIVIFRIRDGKIAEAWEVYDEAGMWRESGSPRRGEQGPRGQAGVKPGRAGSGHGKPGQSARQSGHSPNSSTVCPTSENPACRATSSAHRSTAWPSTSTLRPQLRQVRW